MRGTSQHIRSVGAALIIALAFVATSPPILAQAQPKLSDAQIRQILIDDSKRGYSGPCPCPYNTMRNGRACGGNSAYSKPGGASPLCYSQDVSDAIVQGYRKRTGR